MTNTRQSILLYIRKTAADILWRGMDTAEDWELVMADDMNELLEMVATAIEERADRREDFSPPPYDQYVRPKRGV